MLHYDNSLVYTISIDTELLIITNITNQVRINNWFVSGARQSRSNDGVEPQRHLDDNGRPCGVREVLAVEHEQREDVPGTQRSITRHKVSTTTTTSINTTILECYQIRRDIFVYFIYFNKKTTPSYSPPNFNISATIMIF